MRESLRKFLRTALGSTRDTTGAERPADARVAVAALLVEMARADFTEVPEERALVRRLLAEHFSLEKREAEQLLGLADQQADDAVSLQEFTREIHETLDMDAKLAFLAMLTRIALADGRMDEHERHLLTKIADLIYVPRAQYVTLRDRVMAEHGGQ